MEQISYPMVSVIVPTFNRGYVISRSIESVLNQSYTNWELLIIDDQSKDNTEKIVQEFIKSDKRIQYKKMVT